MTDNIHKVLCSHLTLESDQLSPGLTLYVELEDQWNFYIFLKKSYLSPGDTNWDWDWD